MAFPTDAELALTAGYLLMNTSPIELSEETRTLREQLEFFEARLAAVERPATPWERGMRNAYRGLAEQIRAQLEAARARAAAPVAARARRGAGSD